MAEVKVITPPVDRTFVLTLSEDEASAIYEIVQSGLAATNDLSHVAKCLGDHSVKRRHRLIKRVDDSIDHVTGDTVGVNQLVKREDY